MIVLAIVVILGLVAVYALLNLGAAPNTQNNAASTTDVVIVLQPIARGGIITEDALGYLAYPTEQTISNMIRSKDQVIGLRARYDLEPSVLLMDSMVVSSAADITETGSDTALLIPSGMVAFPIPIDRFSSLAYGLRPGDHVNVIATMLMVDLDGTFQTRLPDNTAGVLGPGGAVISSSQQADAVTSELVVDPLINALTAQIVSSASPQGQAFTDPSLGQPFYVIPSEIQRPRLVSQTLLQNIVVLHVGNFLYTDENGDVVENAFGGVVGTTEDGQTTTVVKAPPDLITLIVSPQDAVTLNYLVYAGAELTMALRSSGDDTIVTTEAVTLEYLLTTYNIPVPTKLPFGLEPRIDSLLSPTRQDVLPQPAQ